MRVQFHHENVSHGPKEEFIRVEMGEGEVGCTFLRGWPRPNKEKRISGDPVVVARFYVTDGLWRWGGLSWSSLTVQDGPI